MPTPGIAAERWLINGSTGDPLLWVDYPDRDDAVLFDAGDNAALPMEKLADLTAVFITHHHVDHFIGVDRIVRANMDRDKVLTLFGPPGTIQKIYDRIRSYEHQFFEFQKIVLELVDVFPNRLCRARLDWSKRFPPPTPVDEPRKGRTIFDRGAIAVESMAVDHTVPCLAFGLVERPAWHVVPEALKDGLLRPGKWVREVAQRLELHADFEERITIQGLEFRIGELAKQYFGQSRGGRLAYVTDTEWSPAVQNELITFCRDADVLYCDSFYAKAQQAAAHKHKHLTTAGAAELAKEAAVKMLVPMHFGTRYRGRYGRLVEEIRAGFTAVFPEID